MTLKPVEKQRMSLDIKRKGKNPNKITFGKVTNFSDKLEFCAYKNEVKPNPMWLNDPTKAKLEGIPKIYPNKFLIFLNGEYIALDIDDWRKIYRIMNKIGHYFGVLGRKKAKKRSKKR